MSKTRAWGIALLASYMVQKEENQTLDAYLEEKVFAGDEGARMEPEPKDVEGFDAFIQRYVKGLDIERAAVNALK